MYLSAIINILYKSMAFEKSLIKVDIFIEKYDVNIILIIHKINLTYNID